MSYKYNPPSGYRPEVTRGDIQDEFRRWNQQANAIVVSDLPEDLRVREYPR